MTATPFKALMRSGTTSGMGTLSHARPFQCKARLCLALFSSNQPTAQRSLLLLPAIASRRAPYPGTAGAGTTDQHIGPAGVGVAADGVCVGVEIGLGVGVGVLVFLAEGPACTGCTPVMTSTPMSVPLRSS